MRGAVPAFDLLPASMRARSRSRPAPWRLPLLAFGAGLLGGLLILAEGQRRTQDELQAMVPLQAELERLQARQRELAPQLRALQDLNEQQQAHAQQRSRWQDAAELLLRLARKPAPSVRFQLLELKLDEQGLLLTGQIPAGEFQSWMSALQLPWGSAQLLELSPSSAVGDVQDGQPEMSRFVLRFASPAGVIVARP